MNVLAYISHPQCHWHEMGPHHPEKPARLAAIEDRLRASRLDMAMQRYDAPRAAKEFLNLAHDAAYVEAIIEAVPAGGLVWLDGDTAINAHSLDAAMRAAGAAQLGVDLVMTDRAKRVFCAVRPPGHHAERHRAMGFCLFNNAALGALHAVTAHGLQRVAIVDFDVHHGNGTEDIVAGDERILFCSTFQHPFYPHTGLDCDAANVVNTPLPAGTAGSAFREAIEAHWLPRLAEFAPELIVVSAGFDAHRADDMGGLGLVEADYAWVTDRLVEQAVTSAGGRMVSTLEGGYELQALARSVEAHLKAMLG